MTWNPSSMYSNWSKTGWYSIQTNPQTWSNLGTSRNLTGRSGLENVRRTECVVSCCIYLKRICIVIQSSTPWSNSIKPFLNNKKKSQYSHNDNIFNHIKGIVHPKIRVNNEIIKKKKKLYGSFCCGKIFWKMFVYKMKVHWCPCCLDPNFLLNIILCVPLKKKERFGRT